jgi:PKHD-type hydroxylase
MKQPGLFGITWQDEIFNAAEIDQIHLLAQQLKPQQNFDMSQSRRTSDTVWLNYADNTKWLYDRVKQAALSINADTYGFEVRGIQTFQYTVYNEATSEQLSGQYPWHSDLSLISDNISIRKLSISIILSDTKNFSGGRFIFAPNGVSTEIIQQQGRMIVFPSWVPHCITPILSGTRISLVTWLHGRKFT